MSERILSISEAQKDLTQLPDQLTNGEKSITVTRYGKPVMTVLSSEAYKSLLETIETLQEKVEALQETLEILQDEETMKAFRQGVADMEAGRTHRLEDVLKEWGWK
ncbi:MAG TPA: type II toxin-antitoxin system Phd/YefM family antitoxin [Ktedonobacter sp.]|nr:type II toxin-antitoxin system Phd/YefM family antitoxin [Ktedonobacter sp.]